MNYLQRKKLALMMNRKFKGYLRTVSGVPLTLTDCIGSELVSLSVVGNADGVGERTANLFDVKTAKKYSGNASLLEVTDNSLTVGQTRAALWASVNVLISEELIGKTVTVSADISTSGANKGGIRIMWLDGTFGVIDLGYIISSYVSSSTPQRISMTGVVPENTTENEYKLCLMFYSNVNATLESGVEYTATYSNIQIELGDTATEYEPYGYKIPLTVSGETESKTYNIYSDTPLYGTEGEEYIVPVITTFKGTTIIMPETSVQPTSMTAEYYARKP